MLSLSRGYALLTRGALLLLALLIPIAFLPWASEPLEIHKQTLLVIFVVAAFLGWLGTAVTSRRLLLRKEWLFVFAVGLLIVGLLSPGIRTSPYLVLVGQAGQEYTSLLTLAMGLLLAWLISHQERSHQLQRQLVTALLSSSALAGLYMLLRLVGVFSMGSPITLAGTPNAGAFVMLAVTGLGCSLWLTSRGEGPHDVLPYGAWGKLVRGLIVFNGLVTLWMLLSIDYSALWVVTLVMTGSMMAFAVIRAHEFPHLTRFLLPITLFICALIFLFVPTLLQNPFPSEVAVGPAGSSRIVGNVLSSQYVLFGSGAGTFSFAYDQYHDPLIAMTDFWDVSFDRASSHVLTMLATFGVVGLVAYGLFVLGILGAIVTKLAREKMHEEWKLTFAPFIAWVTLVTTQLVYPSNMTLQVLFWLFSGILLAQLARPVVDIDFTRSPRAALASAFLFVLMLVGLAMTLFITGLRYAADVAFARAISIDRAGGSLEDVRAELTDAVRTNRWSDTYQRNMSYALLLQTLEALKNKEADPQAVGNLIRLSEATAQRAITLSSQNAANWSSLGAVYREFGLVSEGADALAIEAYTNAILRSPSNPKYYVDLARSYMVRAEKALIAIEGDDETLANAAQKVRDAALEEARIQLEKASVLREEYAPARYYMAYVLERQGKLTDAITSMEYLRVSDPYDVGVAMQLGLLYLKQGKTTLAQAELQRALAIAPNYANAHWYLASIYEQRDDLEAAIAEIEAIASLNPDNETVKQRLASLQSGLAASQLPPPLEESEGDTGGTVTE